MAEQLRSTFVIALGLVTGCSTAGSNPGGNPNASHALHDGRTDGDGAIPIDGSSSSPDATGPMNGVYSIPLSTPTGGDQGDVLTPR